MQIPCVRSKPHTRSLEIQAQPTNTMQINFYRLRTYQCCFILFNVALFHVLLFGADLVEEYFLRALPTTYTDMKILDAREKARKLDVSPLKSNISKAYIISNSEACTHKEIFLLVLTFSSPENASRRNAIRRTWANVTDVKGYSTRILFILGKPSLEATHLEIVREFQEHRDLIEGPFLDLPKNQTLKTATAIEWTVTFCPRARFLLKTDEEMFVNLPNLVDYMLSLRTHLEEIYLGKVIHQEAPNRDPQSPSFIPLQTYPEKYYPDYCSATAFVISQDVARMIYVTAHEVPLSVPPGVFVGICTKKAGVTPIHSSRFSGKKHIRYNRCCYKFIFTSAVSRESQLVQEWKETSDGKTCTLLETYYGLVSCRVMTYLDGFKQLSVDALQNEALHFAD